MKNRISHIVLLIGTKKAGHFMKEIDKVRLYIIVNELYLSMYSRMHHVFKRIINILKNS